MCAASMVAGVNNQIQNKKKTMTEDLEKKNGYRIAIVNGKEVKTGKMNVRLDLQRSMWDGYRSLLEEPLSFIEGVFANAQQASVCAVRMRKAWGLKCKSYKNNETGEYGVMRLAEDEEEEEEVGSKTEESAESVSDTEENVPEVKSPTDEPEFLT